MAQIRTTSPRPAMLSQLALSITATVAATLIVTAVQHEWTVGQPTISHPDLTSGGKFTARVEVLRAAADEAAPAISPQHMPVLVADASLDSFPLTLIEDAASAAPSKTAELEKVSKRGARAEPRRRLAESGLEVVPPRRSDHVVPDAVASGAAEAATGPSGLWSATKGLSRQALWIGEAALDRVNPMNLLP